MRLIDADKIKFNYAPIAPVLQGDSIHWETIVLKDRIDLMPTIDLPQWILCSERLSEEFGKDIRTSDFVSRKYLLDIATSEGAYDYVSADEIANAPSVEPKLDEWCTDCKEYDQEKHCCPRWNRVIRQTVEDLKAERKQKSEQLESAERKKGKWIPQDLNKSDGMKTTAVYFYPKCSICGWTANNTNFCPNRGADMRWK